MWYLKFAALASQGLMAPVEGEGSDGGSGGEAGEGQGQEGGDNAGEASGLPPEGGQKKVNRGWEFDEEQQKALSYDPFAPKSKEEKEAVSGEKSEGGEEEGEPEEKAGEKKEVKEDGSDIAELKKQLEAQGKLLEQYNAHFEKQMKEPEGKKEEEKKGASSQPEIPDYQPFNVPREIRELMTSDDPEKVFQGLGLALQGVAQITHLKMRQEMEKRFESFAQTEVPKKQRELTEEAKAKDTQKQIQADWKKHYPDLATEELKPLVAQVGSQVAAEMNAQEWNEELHKAIAARVRKILGRSEKEPETKETVRRKPPFSSGGTNRQGAPAKVNPIQADISDTLGL